MGADRLFPGGWFRVTWEDGFVEFQLTTATTWVSFKLIGSTCVFKLLRLGAA